MALLMTTSLWDSIDWYQHCPASWKADAYKSLLNQLNRIWAPTKAIERGIAFEKQICYGNNPLEDVAPDLHEKFNEAYAMIHAKGGSFQAKCKKFIEYDGKEFIIYGKQDVHFSPTSEFLDIKPRIIDIKTTGNYRGKSSYLSKWQHKVYTLLDRICDFKYIIFEFNNDSGLLIDVHFIDYHVDDFAAIEKEVIAKVKSVVEFLRNDEKLKLAYLNTFNKYNK